MRILTFDIEDWFHILDNDSTRSPSDWSRFSPRIQKNTDRILELLAEKKVKATFFCLGWVAENHPDVIRRIHSAGYEIASHSHLHQLVYEQSREEFRQDLQRSIGALEDLTGEKVRAYRAPGFSITREIPWAFDTLLKCGIEVDSSVFPARRAHGGFEKFGSAQPAVMQFEGATLREFPINLFSVAGRHLIFSGGGYFRLLPYVAIRGMMKRSPYVMTYFHPRDFDGSQPRIPGLRWHRVFKSYYGLRSAFAKLEKLLGEFTFCDLRTAEAEVAWDEQPTIEISAAVGSGPPAPSPGRVH